VFCYVWEENAVSLLQYVPDSGPFLVLSIWLWFLCFMVCYGGGSFVFLFLLFAFTLPLSFLSFLFGGSIDSVLGIRVGGVLLFFTMSCKTTR
jgi:ABC-type multidrug transport system permease subunit